MLISGFAHERSGEALASLELTAYLVKPFSHADLLGVLARLQPSRTER